MCVGVSASATTTTGAATTTASSTTSAGMSITTPTPYQSGMATSCDKFYDVESGDGCWGIASSYGIALTDFYGWNPGVSSCSALWPSYYVCVGTGAASAAKRTVAVSATLTAGPGTITPAV